MSCGNRTLICFWLSWVLLVTGVLKLFCLFLFLLFLFYFFHSLNLSVCVSVRLSLLLDSSVDTSISPSLNSQSILAVGFCGRRNLGPFYWELWADISSPFKALSRSEYSDVCFAHCQEFLPCPSFYRPGLFYLQLFSISIFNSICLC